jgi:release factor glutamine methyltransferase
VETVLELVKEMEPASAANLKLVDVGSGSGAIALALARELPLAKIYACDISDEALEISRANSARLGLEQRIQFRKSDLLSAYAGERFDFVVSNPPYVGESEADTVQKQVREFEPKIAVFSGQEGMDIYRRLIPQVKDALQPGGWFVCEIGFSAEQKIRDLLKGWMGVRVTKDLQGIPRVIAARKT